MEYIFNMYAGFGMNFGKVTIFVLLYVGFYFVILYNLAAEKLLETSRNKKYIYTRTVRRSRFYLRGMWEQYKSVFFRITIFNLLVWGIDEICGFTIRSEDKLWMILLLNYLHIAFTIALLNVFSLIFKVSFVTNCIFAMNIFSVLAAGFYAQNVQESTWWFKWIPSISALPEFHKGNGSLWINAGIIGVETLVIIVIGSYLALRLDVKEV